jgi:hypothetical protein
MILRQNLAKPIDPSKLFDVDGSPTSLAAQVVLLPEDTVSLVAPLYGLATRQAPTHHESPRLPCRFPGVSLS